MTKKERAALTERISGYELVNSDRFYMVTFDLKGARGREALYAKFGSHLRAFVGRENAHRFIKQCYFVRCRFKRRDVRTEMQRLLSGRDSILVAQLAPGASFLLTQQGVAQAARQFFADLRDTHEGN